MKYLLDFLNQDLKKSKIYELIKCGDEEGEILKYLSKAYVQGTASMSVFELLGAVFGTQNDKQLLYLKFIKNLLGSGWIVQNYSLFKMPENSQKSSNQGLLSLLHSEISLSSTFLKILEDGNADINLPELAPYEDHLEYLKDQFLKIELYS
ncbi:MAG: AAA family ATPase, partial [Campylobacter concisus]|nr:AAA family ATPase [Campylobacter concisus]